jgi:hypothetical protein
MMRQRDLRRHHQQPFEGSLPRVMEICDLIDSKEVFRRAEPLAGIHHAISYRELLDRLDPSERWDIWHRSRDSG